MATLMFVHGTCNMATCLQDLSFMYLNPEAFSKLREGLVPHRRLVASWAELCKAACSPCPLGALTRSIRMEMGHDG
eukprot:3306677-Amphidinium_carterae.3